MREIERRIIPIPPEDTGFEGGLAGTAVLQILAILPYRCGLRLAWHLASPPPQTRYLQVEWVYKRSALLTMLALG